MEELQRYRGAVLAFSQNKWASVGGAAVAIILDTENGTTRIVGLTSKGEEIEETSTLISPSFAPSNKQKLVYWKNGHSIYGVSCMDEESAKALFDKILELKDVVPQTEKKISPPQSQGPPPKPPKLAKPPSKEVMKPSKEDNSQLSSLLTSFEGNLLEGFDREFSSFRSNL